MTRRHASRTSTVWPVCDASEGKSAERKRQVECIVFLEHVDRESAADITLMHNDLMSVADAIRLSRATLRKIRQNLFFAFFYNALGIPLAALGLLNPVIAGAAMALSSVSVVGNALLLKRWHPVQS